MIQYRAPDEATLGASERGLAELIADRSSRRGLAICVSCAAAQQLSGINNAFNFSSTFLARNGADADAVTAVAIGMNVRERIEAAPARRARS